MSTFRRQMILFLATGGWIGYSPAAPGTFGSLAALPLCFFLAKLTFWPGLILLFALLTMFTWIAHEAERIVGMSDPKQVVIDEIGGMAVTLFTVPFTPAAVICGFALFRVFDILKPLPIRWVDKRVPGGLGIMLDDIIAGVFANVVLQIVF